MESHPSTKNRVVHLYRFSLSYHNIILSKNSSSVYQSDVFNSTFFSTKNTAMESFTVFPWLCKQLFSCKQANRSDQAAGMNLLIQLGRSFALSFWRPVSLVSAAMASSICALRLSQLLRHIGEFLLHEGLRGLLIARVDLEGTGDLFDVCIICDPLLLQ